MKTTFIIVLSIAACVICGAAIFAAPGQTVARPGEMVPARMWIENRGRGEAIPVTLEGFGELPKPLRVEVAGVPTVTLTPSTVVDTKTAFQRWDHQAITIPAGQVVEVALRAAGNDGWEAVSAQVLPNGATFVLLKRPR